jgi:hypothetical protein
LIKDNIEDSFEGRKAMKIGGFEIKRVKNTKWDYIVPLGLQAVIFFVLILLFGAAADLRTEEEARNFFNLGISVGILFLGAFIFLTIFLQRKHRILVLPVTGIFGLLVDTLSSKINYLITFRTLFGVLSLAGIGFFFGNLLVISKYGLYNDKPTDLRIQKPYFYGFIGSILGFVFTVPSEVLWYLFPIFITGKIVEKILFFGKIVDFWLYVFIFQTLIWFGIFWWIGNLVESRRIKKIQGKMARR